MERDRDDEPLWRAMTSRDRRFEGVFVVGVRTTGIYCRPGCPARIPKRANVTFYTCAAAAESAGFRACMRCRPDASPGAPAALGTPATVARALRLIGEGALDAERLESFAERLGVGGRHLRRLFETHVGASPQAVAQTQRLHLARQLIESTAMPMTEIAHASGFASVRRFNDAVRTTFASSPTDLRRKAPRARDGVTLRLPFRPPYDWDAMLAFLGTRAIAGVERVENGVYSRTIAVSGSARGTIDVSLDGPRHVRLAVTLDRRADLLFVVARVRRLFDLDADPLPIAEHLERDRRLAASVRARPGLRVPGAWDALEIAVRAILGQQVSVGHARELAGRLAQRFGTRLRDDAWIFPDARAIAKADIASLGMPRARAATIRAVAELAIEDPDALEDETKLLAVPGIGPWTAAYVAMRAARDPDALPASDLGLYRTLDLGSATAVTARAERWRPWRAYAVMHLWNEPEKRKIKCAS